MKSFMKAGRLHRLREPIVVEDVPIPTEIGAREVLVKVKACGICHTDLSLISGALPPPRLPFIPGHEPAGIIEKVGEAVKGLKVGDRVCVNSVISCGRCHYCVSGRWNLCINPSNLGVDWDGGWAEYMKAPAFNCCALPEEIPFEQGAIITDAVATTFHAMKRGEVKVGDIVAIFGVGGLGINAIQMAKAFGATKIIAVDRKEEKRELALAAGADEAVNLESPTLREDIKKLSGGEGVDVAFEFIGLDSTIEKTIESLRRGGKAVIAGVYTGTFKVSAHPLIVKEIEIRGVWTELQQDFPTVVELVRSGRVDLSKSITHRIPLEEVNRGLEILEKRIGNPLRIVIIP
ncbi:alcohol dehydrogenase catalytic domain-containing protein [Chloroflexota bacterium]